MPEYIHDGVEATKLSDRLLDELGLVYAERDLLLLENLELRSENQALQFLKNDFEAAVASFLAIGQK